MCCNSVRAAPAPSPGHKCLQHISTPSPRSHAAQPRKLSESTRKLCRCYAEVMQKLPEVTRKLCRGSQEQKTKKREGGWDSRREGRCATLKKKRPDVRSKIPPSVGRKMENYEKSERGWDFWGLNRERGWDNSAQGRRGWLP